MQTMSFYGSQVRWLQYTSVLTARPAGSEPVGDKTAWLLRRV
jgi:hypothetical protein